MNSDRDTRYRVGCPIRRSRDHRSLASPPGFSQRATSFIASQCQGIHQMPFFALDPDGTAVPSLDTAAHRGKTLPGIDRAEPRRRPGPTACKAASHEDTFRTGTRLLAAEPIRLGHMTNSLFTLQSAPPARFPDGVSPNASPSVAHPRRSAGGGGERIRTDDLLLAKQALSQLSYTPVSGIRKQGSGIRSSDP